MIVQIVTPALEITTVHAKNRKIIAMGNGSICLQGRDEKRRQVNLVLEMEDIVEIAKLFEQERKRHDIKAAIILSARAKCSNSR